MGTTKDNLNKGTKRVVDSTHLPNTYTVVDEAHVEDFRQRYPEVTSLLLDLDEKIEEYFPQFKDVRLEVEKRYNDPELDVFIVVDMDVAEALSILDKFDEDWWLERNLRYDFGATVHIDFFEK